MNPVYTQLQVSLLYEVSVVRSQSGRNILVEAHKGLAVFVVHIVSKYCCTIIKNIFTFFIN